MEPAILGLIGIVTLIVVSALGMPVGAAMMLIGFTGTFYLTGLKSSLGMVAIVPYEKVWSYTLSVTPLFILMGAIFFQSGIATRLYHTAYKWIGHLPGGLGMATVLACGGFAAVSGSSIATAASMGTVALPEMERYAYRKSFAAGIVAAGGTLGILIPPSIVFILYGIMTEQSIGQLFMAGIIPGIIEIIIYLGVILVVMKFRPGYAARARRVPFKEMMRTLPAVWPVLLLFLLVLGGLYFGFFTPTEAGAIGAFGALVISVASGWFSREKMALSLADTVRTTGMVLFILVGAFMFSFFLAISNLPFAMAEIATASQLPPHGVLAFILIIYLVLGCFMDSLAMMLLTIPIFTPVLFSLGFDPIWVGVIICRIIEIALITPPYGMNLFVLKGVAKDIPLEQIFLGVLPFVIGDLILLALLVIFPQIALFLPGLMWQ